VCFSFLKHKCTEKVLKSGWGNKPEKANNLNITEGLPKGEKFSPASFKSKVHPMS